MSRARGTAVALALVGALVTAGCGLGPGDSEGTVELSVTRDYGAETLVRADPAGAGVGHGPAAARPQRRGVTRYGGRFVQSIDGLAGGADRRAALRLVLLRQRDRVADAARPSSTCAGGDRVWWDYRDWTQAMRVPAVVGAWPEPFVHGFDGERWPASVECGGRRAPAAEVAVGCEDAGAELAARSRRRGRWAAAGQRPGRARPGRALGGDQARPGGAPGGARSGPQRGVRRLHPGWPPRAGC